MTKLWLIAGAGIALYFVWGSKTAQAALASVWPATAKTTANDTAYTVSPNVNTAGLSPIQISLLPRLGTLPPALPGASPQTQSQMDSLFYLTQTFAY